MSNPIYNRRLFQWIFQVWTNVRNKFDYPGHYHILVVIPSDSEDEDDEDDEFLIQMNAETETIQKQVRNKVSEEKIQMRKQLGGKFIDFGENCWRKISTATKKGLHVIGKMPGRVFRCENRLETYFQSRQMNGTTLLGKRQKFCAVVIRKINAS